VKGALFLLSLRDREPMEAALFFTTERGLSNDCFEMRLRVTRGFNPDKTVDVRVTDLLQKKFGMSWRGLGLPNLS
jgi:hypothetical protein